MERGSGSVPLPLAGGGRECSRPHPRERLGPGRTASLGETERIWQERSTRHSSKTRLKGRGSPPPDVVPSDSLPRGCCRWLRGAMSSRYRRGGPCPALRTSSFNKHFSGARPGASVGGRAYKRQLRGLPARRWVPQTPLHPTSPDHFPQG